MDVLLGSCIGIAYPEILNVFFDEIDGMESLQIKSNYVNCSSYDVCVEWAKYHTNILIYLLDKFAEICYANDDLGGDNSEPLLCKIEDGVFISFGQSMLMLHGDPLMGRVNEIIDRVVEAGLHKFGNPCK